MRVEIQGDSNSSVKCGIEPACAISSPTFKFVTSVSGHMGIELEIFRGNREVSLMIFLESFAIGSNPTTNTQSPNPYRLGFFLPAPPVKTPLASRASRPGRRVFRPDSLKFFSLLSIHPKSGESFARTSSMMDAGKVPKLRNPQESFHFCSHVQHHLSGHDSLLLGPPDLPVQ